MNAVMSRRTQQAAHRRMRARIMPRESVFRYVYSEVVAWNDAHDNVLADKAMASATAVTNAIYSTVATGITEHMRYEMIHNAVHDYMCAMVPR